MVANSKMSETRKIMCTNIAPWYKTSKGTEEIAQGIKTCLLNIANLF